MPQGFHRSIERPPISPHLIRKILLPVHGQPTHGPKDVPQNPLVKEGGFGQGSSGAIQNSNQDEGIHEGVGVVGYYHEGTRRNGAASALNMEEDARGPSEKPGEERFSFGHFRYQAKVSG